MKHLFAALAFLLFATPVLAADIKPLNLGKNTQVWFAEDHSVPIITLVASLPAGSAYDPADKPGLAAFTAALFDEGAGNLNSKAFQEAVANRAIRMRAGVERDYMTISVTTLSENLPEAMRLLQLALTKPRFDADAILRVRTQIIQGLAQGESDAPTVARRAFVKAFFNGHPYGHSSDGDAASIAAITAGDLRGFAKSHWVRGGLKLVIAGDITAPTATKVIGDAFKPVSAATPPPPPPIGRLGQPGTHVIPLPVPQASVIFGLPGIMRKDSEFIPGYVANYILGGGGFSSRLTEELRSKRGLTYGVSTSLSTYNRASVMLGSIATRANAVKQTVQVIRDTLANFATNGPTQQELDDAKTYLTGSFPLGFASNAGIASQLSGFQRQGLDIGYVTRRNALIQAVTLDDVRKVARHLYNPARMTVIVAGTAGDGRAAERPKPPVRPDAPAPGTPPVAAKPPVQPPVSP